MAELPAAQIRVVPLDVPGLLAYAERTGKDPADQASPPRSQRVAPEPAGLSFGQAATKTGKRRRGARQR
jgi:hypothetical protein